MKKLTSKKKNTIIAVAMVAVLAIGASFAYFIDRASVTNSFTVGDIEIELTEPNWDPTTGEKITPNKEMAKDPTITNIGVNDAYMFMSVKVPRANVKTAQADGTIVPAAEQDLFTYTVNNGWKQIKSEVITEDGKKYTEYIYAFEGTGGKMTTVNPNGKTAPVFNSVKFINVVEEQLDGEDLQIVAEAMGIQVADLGTEDPLEIFNIVLKQKTTDVAGN